jgi:hypothetical protein
MKAICCRFRRPACCSALAIVAARSPSPLPIADERARAQRRAGHVYSRREPPQLSSCYCAAQIDNADVMNKLCSSFYCRMFSSAAHCR